jgi:excisionase family DNA binding protein
MAEYLGIKKDTLYKWIKWKDIPVHKLGKLWKFNICEVDNWIIEGKAGDKRKKDAI